MSPAAQARFLGATSHDAFFSFSCQGDMGALGPIGYPGPKGVKVNEPSLNPGLVLARCPPLPWPKAAQREVGLGSVLGERWAGIQRGGLRASRHLYVTMADMFLRQQSLSWAGVS